MQGVLSLKPARHNGGHQWFGTPFWRRAGAPCATARRFLEWKFCRSNPTDRQQSPVFVLHSNIHADWQECRDFPDIGLVLSKCKQFLGQIADLWRKIYTEKNVKSTFWILQRSYKTASVPFTVRSPRRTSCLWSLCFLWARWSWLRHVVVRWFYWWILARPGRSEVCAFSAASNKRIGP